jgi:hypothetical protein
MTHFYRFGHTTEIDAGAKNLETARGGVALAPISAMRAQRRGRG